MASQQTASMACIVNPMARSGHMGRAWPSIAKSCVCCMFVAAALTVSQDIVSAAEHES